MLPTEQGIPAARAEQYSGELKLQRKNWLNKVCEAAGVGAEEADNFAFRLMPKVMAWGRETTEQRTLLGKGLVEGRWVKIPLLTVFTKNGWPAERGADLLRASFIDLGAGDMEIVPRFWLGFEGINERGVYGLDKRGLINIFSTVLDGSQCIGFRCESKPEAEEKKREMNKIFYTRLPKSREFLFDKNGFLRDERKLDSVAKELARRVNLDKDWMSDAELASFYGWLRRLYNKNNTCLLIDDFQETFNLQPGNPWRLLTLDGDIRVEAKRERELVGRHNRKITLTIEDILMPRGWDEGKKPLLHQIVRSEAGSSSPKGDLIIGIVEGNQEGESVYTTVEIEGFRDVWVDASSFRQPEKLAAILAKLEIAS